MTNWNHEVIYGKIQHATASQGIGKNYEQP
jgi:hypothetical protein